MFKDDALEIAWNQEVEAYFSVSTIRALSGITEANHENLSQDSHCPDLVSNSSSFEYKAWMLNDSL